MLIGRADTSKMLAPARGGLGFYKAYQENKLKALVDFENLLTAWGLYQETEGYKDLVKNPVEGFADFKNDMDKIKIRYYEK